MRIFGSTGVSAVRDCRCSILRTPNRKRGRDTLTGEIRSQIDGIWNAFWSGGISNPLEVIEQITYLLFLRRLDDIHTLAENKAARTKKPIEERVFPSGKDAKQRPYEDSQPVRYTVHVKRSVVSDVRMGRQYGR